MRSCMKQASGAQPRLRVSLIFVGGTPRSRKIPTRRSDSPTEDHWECHESQKFPCSAALAAAALIASPARSPSAKTACAPCPSKVKIAPKQANQPMTKIDKLTLPHRCRVGARLNPASYKVLRDEGTERAFTSPLNDESAKGVFHCAGFATCRSIPAK